jgi:DNA-directed RNA polymerase sigma subunit (sigma70/sigma32)
MTNEEMAALDELVFALSGPHSTEAIAARLGLQQDSVRAIELRALEKMRRELARKRLAAKMRRDAERRRLSLGGFVRK